MFRATGVNEAEGPGNNPNELFQSSRLADHLNSCNTFSLRRVRYLVLDEADRMFDGSFDQQLQQILSVLPSKKRQTLLFTATISDTLSKLKEVAMNKPFIYEAAKSQVLNGL